MLQAQRAAMFARLHNRTQRTEASLRRGAEKTRPVVLGGVAGAALATALNPKVTHIAGPFAQGLKPFAKEIYKGYPQLRYYPAVPAAAAYIASRTGHGKKPTQKESVERAGAAGAVGLASFLGERAMFHSIPALVPPHQFLPAKIKSMVPPQLMPSAKLRGELVFQHGVPLAVSALALGGLAHHVAKKQGFAKQQDAFGQIRRGALIGLATVGAHFGGTHLIPKLISKPVIAKNAQRAVDMGVPPVYLSYQAFKNRKAKRAAAQKKAS